MRLLRRLALSAAILAPATPLSAAAADVAAPETATPSSPESCSGGYCVYNIHVGSSQVKAGTILPITWQTTGAMNYYSVAMCQVPNSGYFCYPPDVVMMGWPTPVNVPVQARVPACAALGLYKAVVHAGPTTSVGTYDWSNAFNVVAGAACVTNVVADTPAGQGFTTTIRWNTSTQTRYSIDLLHPDGGYHSAIAGWVTSSGARTHSWTIPQGLPPANYKVRVNVENNNGAGVGSGETAVFTIQSTPTVANVAFAAVDSCFGGSSTYADSPVNVSWSSTNQSRWELFDCPTGGSACNGPVRSGNNAAQSTTWTPPPNLIGDRRLLVRVTSNGFTREAQSGSILNLRERPSVDVEWQSYNTSVPESQPTMNVSAIARTTPAGLPLPQRVDLYYQSADVTATAGVDYSRRESSTHGPIVFPACAASGSTAALPVAINIGQDPLDETDERFQVQLTGASGAYLGTLRTHDTTILDDDATPTLSVGDPTATEGQNAVFVVTLSAASGRTVTVNAATADGTAVAASDYSAVGTTVTFNPGQVSRNVVVATTNDSTYEPTESFALLLSGAQNATIADGQASGTVLDNDPPAASIGDARVSEGNGSPAALTFPITLEAAPNQAATVQWSIDACTTSSDDYSPASGTVTIPAGSSTQSITLFTQGDLAPEGHELLKVNLSNPVNVSLADASAQGAIDNDDLPAPTASMPTADFNADGDPDLLWFNTASGNLVAWLMTGVNRDTGAFLDPPAIGHINWRVVGTPNFDLDAHSDVLWRNETSGRLVAWFMNGLVRTSGVFLNPDREDDLAWQVAGTGQYGGSAQSDIVWRHQTTGAVRFWIMDGINRQSLVDIGAVSDLGWKVIGTGDLDRDGDGDLWWRHEPDGVLMVWRMNGTNVVEALGVSPATQPDAALVVATNGDIDRDGDPDLLWRNSSSGELKVWLMNGTQRACEATLNPSSSIDPNWLIVGPR